MAETRGRPPDSGELRAAKVRLKKAPDGEARIAAQAAVDEIKAREKAARSIEASRTPATVYSEEELFRLLVECDPRIREAEAAKAEAVERLHAERKALASAFGGMAAARRRLELFRRAQTAEGQEEARALIEMHRRVSARQDQDTFAPAAAA